MASLLLSLAGSHRAELLVSLATACRSLAWALSCLGARRFVAVSTLNTRNLAWDMSSVTVLFILDRFLESAEFAPGDLGVLSAMGPGFSAEHVLFRC